ncbi:glutamate dehydrogenase (NADP+) [Strigomonas culicis]|uniref:Glutamate dehydrogenase n=1 Tax=Strigomonas culicis TaxID=28005 RepID=S9UE29_9TRYP|nr:glutamate dehydrogenase (NADP+) [Strigomonas culicis]|eukprot:EPY26984.1 glutamate dehydrogenase (NADP+) [Strigomonas culicis]
MTSLWPFLEKNPKYAQDSLLERLVEPERVIQFRVPWIDDKGVVHVNRAFRVQYNSSIGPYKGGMRFHPSVNLSILKFLGFEQTFKNSLTTLPIGGGKGGSDFDPKGKSDKEVMRFCQSLVSELFRHVGADTDVPAGDIGVGGREVGYMNGMYWKLSNTNESVFTGKGLSFQGSEIRPEATGYGLVYFVEAMLAERKETLKGKTVVVSGSGNVSQYAMEKCIQLGAKVLAASDSAGMVYEKDGITQEKLEVLKDIKNNKRTSLAEYAKLTGAEYTAGKRPWTIKSDIALPCATQNELEIEDAKNLIANGTTLVAEGANMPTTEEATIALRRRACSSRRARPPTRVAWPSLALRCARTRLASRGRREEVDARLHGIMNSIHTTCSTYGKGDNGVINYVDGANIGGFVKVADAMIGLGVV